MTPSYSRHIEEDARLVILTELYRQPAGRLSESSLVHVLHAFGHDRSREWVRTQLNKMAELGAVENSEAGTVMIAQITKAGVGHILRHAKIEGIKQPSLGV